MLHVTLSVVLFQLETKIASTSGTSADQPLADPLDSSDNDDEVEETFADQATSSQHSTTTIQQTPTTSQPTASTSSAPVGEPQKKKKKSKQSPADNSAEEIQKVITIKYQWQLPNANINDMVFPFQHLLQIKMQWTS